LKYSFTLSETYLSTQEQEVFGEYLRINDLDEGIWEIFKSLFQSGLKRTRPMMLRIFDDGDLQGAIILTRCSKYGRALFNNRILSGFTNFLGIPYYQWIKFGCCMDMMSNPGFARDPEQAENIYREATGYLRKKGLLTIITDYSDRSDQYDKASVLPALPHALIDCSEFKTLDDYLINYKNLKRKIRVFEIKGGEFTRAERILDDNQLAGLRNCFVSTSEQSVFYLPYQELYLSAALNTSKTEIKNTVYFIAYLDGEFLGYQAALKTGKYLNALHGAFDRNRRTTYHAYDILFVKMVEFAISEKLQFCDFGAVLNYTKQKMVNRTIGMSYFILSKYYLLQKLFNMFLKITKIQGNEQLKFLNVEDH